MDVSTALEEYRYAILMLADSTQHQYYVRLSAFAQWCAEQGVVLEQIRPTLVNRYFHVLLTVPSEETEELLSTYTVHGYARAIRTFLNWCAAEPQQYLLASVGKNLTMPKIQQKIIERFSERQIRAFFVACEAEKSSFLIARNKAIVAVLIDTGIRAAELCGLTTDRVSLSVREGYIRVLAKGKRVREVPLGTKSRQLLHSWLKKYRHAPAGEMLVFLNYRRGPLTTSGLDQMIYTLADRAKITGVRCSAHTFRHTYAMNFLLQGGDVYVLSRLMGHSSVQTTEIYLRAIKADQARRISKSVLDNL